MAASARTSGPAAPFNPHMPASTAAAEAKLGAAKNTQATVTASRVSACASGAPRAGRRPVAASARAAKPFQAWLTTR